MTQHPSLIVWIFLAYCRYCFVSGAPLSHQEHSENNGFLRGRTIERQLNTDTLAKCDCDSCTEEVLSSIAEGYSCGDRIDWIVSNRGFSESEACSLIGGDEYPSICGSCDPSKCLVTASDPTPSPNNDQNTGSDPSSFQCGCDSCTDEIWNTMAGDYTCGARITWLQGVDVETLSSLGITGGLLDEAGACRIVSEEFSDTCKCNPEKCNEPITASPTSKPTFTPTDSPTKKPTSSPTASPTTKKPTPSPTTSTSAMCGCNTCTDQVLSYDAGGYACRDRINWIISNRGLSEFDSCKVVADEFPSNCGKCHSDHCGSFPPTSAPLSETLKVMSYNTEYTGYYDGRVPNFADKIREVSADVVGLQECQNPYTLADLSGYALLGGTGPQNYILYDANRLQDLERGFMDVPRDQYAQRTVTWGKFRVIKGAGIGDEFWFFNTHLPHNGNEASSRNTHAGIAQSLLAKRDELGAGNSPTIVVGDCNPFASSGASEGSFESNLATGGIVKVYEGRGNTGGYGGLDKMFASQEHWTWSNAADRGTGTSDHPVISADMFLK